MLEYRKRRGTTLVELSLVIAILAMIVLPFATFVAQNLRNTVQSSAQLKEQLVLEQVMQDMEKHLRSAIRTPEPVDDSIAGKVVFYSIDPEDVVDTRPSVNNYTYALAGGVFTKTVGTGAGTKFPDGLEAGMITSMTFPTSSLTTAPYYITVWLQTGTTELKKTIYLRNY
jgi:Tfp pilus assembly protein PilE